MPTPTPRRKPPARTVPPATIVEPVPPPEVAGSGIAGLFAGVDVRLDRDDLVNVFVDAAETRWKADLAGGLADVERLGRAIAAEEAALAKVVVATDLGDLQRRGDAVVAACVPLRLAATARTKVGSLDRSTRQVAVELSLRVGDGYSAVNVVEQAPLGAAGGVILDRIAALVEERERHVAFASAVRRRLADLAGLERKVKAEIAKNLLGQTATGSAWLRALEGRMAGEIDVAPLRAQLKLAAV